MNPSLCDAVSKTNCRVVMPGEFAGTTPDTASPNRQFVWGPRYIDDIVLRDRETTGTGTLDERLYSMQDANWDVVAVATPAALIQERYAYSPYGVPVFLTGTFTARTSSSYNWDRLFTGQTYDTQTGLHYFRNRMLHSQVGMFITRDPIGYSQNANLFYAGFTPSTVDPLGLALIAIDGTDSADWLQDKDGRLRRCGRRWMTHVKNFWQDYETDPSKKRYYDGPGTFGGGTQDIIDDAVSFACNLVCKDANEPIDLVGWSRGALAVSNVARRLLTNGCWCPCRKFKFGYKVFPRVRFVGLYDPVDMCTGVEFRTNLSSCERVVQFRGDCTAPGPKTWPRYDGVDYWNGTNNPSLQWPRCPKANSPTPDLFFPINCTHGAIGGCPGYSAGFPPDYNYNWDRQCSIRVDTEMRWQAYDIGLPISPTCEYPFGDKCPSNVELGNSKY